MRVTIPGRYGDILWALPTCRALAEQEGEPVTLIVSPAYSDPAFCALVQAQPYIAEVQVDPAWIVYETAPMTPRQAPSFPDDLALGYSEWPRQPLPFEQRHFAQARYPDVPPLRLEDPWITRGVTCEIHGAFRRRRLARPDQLFTGFTDEHFELKFGVRLLVEDAIGLPLCNLAGPGSRWTQEGGVPSSSWLDAATCIHRMPVFLACCSALHVLAVAMGTPVVLMEPNPQRWHPVFYPLGTKGPRVTLVHGTDGQPTWDARHVVDALLECLERRHGTQTTQSTTD